MSRDYQKHPSLHPRCIYLRMKYRCERLFRSWRLDYTSTMVWRVYTTENSRVGYYNIFAKTKWEAVKSILKYIWHGPGALIKI